MVNYIHNHSSVDKSNRMKKIWSYSVYFLLSINLFLCVEKFKNLHEKMNYYTTAECSKENIEEVLTKLHNRYEEEFGFLYYPNKVFTFSPYFYFVMRCIPLETIIEQTKGLPYGFVRSILLLKYKFIVESHLKNCIDPISYNFGHYDKQHARIWKLPNKRWVYLILKNIIKNPEYSYIILDIDIGYYKTMRILAVDALSDATYRKDKLIKLLKSLVSMKGIENEINNIDLYDLSFPALMSLGVLGETEFVNLYINNIRTLQTLYLFKSMLHIFYYLQTKIMDLYVYTKQYKNALSIARELLLIGGDKTFFYNLACLFSLMGKKHQALHFLRKAIKAGYSDLHWLKKDKELDLIRNTKEFKHLIKHLEKKLKAE